MHPLFADLIDHLLDVYGRTMAHERSTAWSPGPLYGDGIEDGFGVAIELVAAHAGMARDDILGRLAAVWTAAPGQPTPSGN
jgi:hypothetical protein